MVGTTAQINAGCPPAGSLHLNKAAGCAGTFNFVCEIPKDTSAKMEVATVRRTTLQPRPCSHAAHQQPSLQSFAARTAEALHVP